MVHAPELQRQGQQRCSWRRSGELPRVDGGRGRMGGGGVRRRAGRDNGPGWWSAPGGGVGATLIARERETRGEMSSVVVPGIDPHVTTTTTNYI